jgi:hypothetical protein
MITLLACIATGAIVTVLCMVRERNGWMDRYQAAHKTVLELRSALRFMEQEIAHRRGHDEARETDGVYRLVEAGLKKGEVVIASRKKGEAIHA